MTKGELFGVWAIVALGIGTLFAVIRIFNQVIQFVN